MSDQADLSDLIRKAQTDMSASKAYSCAGIAIAFLRERWTSEAAVERAWGELSRSERNEYIKNALTAAMWDS